jgi:hypothetical protein
MNETMETIDVLKEMATEDTGRHMLDSGGAYGRNWERNRQNGVKEVPVAELGINIWSDNQVEIGVTLNVVPWLETCLEFDAELDAEFQAFAMSPEYKDEHWLGCMEAFAESRGGGGLYGDGRPTTINTYNHESALSQVIQFTAWTEPDSDSHNYFSHVLLQIHGGCDVRGGYTRPRVFECYDDSGISILDDHRCGIYCDGGKHGCLTPGQQTLDGSDAVTDCRANWSSENGGYSFDLEDGGVGPDTKGLGEYEIEVREPMEFPTGEAGKLVVVKDARGEGVHEAFCPKCGVGRLEGSPW